MTALPKLDWRQILRHYLQVVAFCFAIAAINTAIWPDKGYGRQLFYSLIIGSLVWGIIEFGRHLLLRPDDPGGWPQGWRRVGLTAAAIVIGFLVGSKLADMLLGSSGSNWGALLRTDRESRVGWLITVAAGIVGTYYFYSRGHRAALAARVNAAERDASEARLKLLESQLEPHMLFNTLANLRALISLDPERAIAMLDRLDNYLRATLAGARVLLHPLQAEFDRLGDYLALMAVRMGDRLRFTLELPPEARHFQVPPMLLQPLVENCIRHGLEPKVDGGDIRISARIEQRAGHDAGLLLEVLDSGIGLPAPAPAGFGEKGAADASAGGFGLTHVRERLATVYGPRARFSLSARPEGGTLAQIHIPLEKS